VSRLALAAALPRFRAYHGRHGTGGHPDLIEAL
jgi:hypothetical protein